eukprot:TRINITY_DN14812_c0_g1_i1.p1 TRINITY_DN14812_c0_g1~~TRINITY_DN14812_c0_g1_i1.p1  ORF type:complete len:102 (+),score=24.64 TRINITY_DN14812_c0_g1_i1:394-699(+)
MSDIIYSSDFANIVEQKRGQLRPIDKHEWIFDVHDIAVLQEKVDDQKLQFGFLAEMGGVQGLATALRTDIKAGLYEDECKEEIGRAVQQECRDRSRMPSSA